MAMNMVGTPWKAVICSLLMQSRAQTGREGRDGGHGSAVCHSGSHGQHHAEAMEHGDLNHQAVGGGEIHAVADGLAVVDDIVVGQHNALLGNPVVPEVYCILQTSCLLMAAARR